MPFTRSENHTVSTWRDSTVFRPRTPRHKTSQLFLRKIQKIQQRELSSIQVFHIFFTWNKKEHKWRRRKQGSKNPKNPDECRTDCIGRIPTKYLRPHQAELYYLRLQLHHKPGTTSFEDFEECSNARGIGYQIRSTIETSLYNCPHLLLSSWSSRILAQA